MAEPGCGYGLVVDERLRDLVEDVKGMKSLLRAVLLALLGAVLGLVVDVVVRVLF